MNKFLKVLAVAADIATIASLVLTVWMLVR